MFEKIAIKRLRASDCTLFEAIFRQQSGGSNQKSINLNADVFVKKLFPSMASIALGSNSLIALPINIYGPEGKPPYSIARKIVRKASYKNWRLNGEVIYGPPGDPTRYDHVQPGDFAVMIFQGDAMPTGIDLILVGQSNVADSTVHASLATLIGGKRMIAATTAEIANAIGQASIPQDHPIFIAAADPTFDMNLEDAALGGLEGTTKLLQNRHGRKTLPEDLARAKVKAQLTGQTGEELVNVYLAGKLAVGEISDFTWISAENAIAPFDFKIVGNNGETTLVDAKSTSGAFEQSIHLSLAEIIEAAGSIPYRVYRVFEMADDGGKLRISDEIGSFAAELKSLHELHLPQGLRVDSFSVATSALSWGALEVIEALEQDNDD